MVGAEVAGRGQRMLLAAGPDLAHQLQRVRVKHKDLVLLLVDDIKKTVVVIDRQSHGINQPLHNLPFNFMFGIEDQNPLHLAVGDEKPVGIVDS